MSNNLELFQLHSLAVDKQWQSICRILLSALDSNDADGRESLQNHLTKCEGVQSWTPLMLSCACAPPEVIFLFLKCCPISCTISDRSGSFPIHFVCSYRRGTGEDLPDVIRKLLFHSPDSVSKQNLWGQTPLHCIFDGDVMAPVDAIRELLGLKNNRDFDKFDKTMIGTKSTSDDDQLTENESIEVESEKRAIIRCHVRKALSQPDNKSFLPLHLAASKGASEEVLRMLISIYPEAASVTTSDGDLPIHLLQYYAEDISCTTSSEKGTENNKNLDDVNINAQHHQTQLKMFFAVTIGQIEALLEPLCTGSAEKLTISDVGTILGTNAVGVKENGTLIAISERDEEDTENEISVEKMKGSVSSKTSASAAVHSLGACRSLGSRRTSLIHVAAQHGVSYQLLASLCEQYPEGAAMPKSMYISFGVDKKSFDVYPIELFENGRAQLDIMRNLHIANRMNSVLSSDTFSAINRFHEKSDLLFAYYPDAVPSNFFGRNNMIPYQKESKRLYRLEDLIINGVSDCSKRNINIITRLAWSWLYRCAKFLNPNEKGIYQACIGRIITVLPDVALWKLGCITRSITTNKHPSIISSSIGIVEEAGDDAFSFWRLGRFINEQNIKEEALKRAPNTTMTEMLQMLDMGESNINRWHDNFINYLSGSDGLNYSCACRRTRSRGLRFETKRFLGETGRSWNLPPRNELNGGSEFWQQLDQYLTSANSTHLVYITYYIEVSEAKLSSYQNQIRINPESISETFKGGLQVLSESSHVTDENKQANNVSEGARATPSSIKVVAKEQIKLASSKFCTREGCEVQLCFKYEPGNTYSLHVYGPIFGGRVSISSARIRKLVRKRHGKQHSEEEELLPRLSMNTKKLSSTKLCTNGQLQLHHALKDGVSVEDLSVLIAANPSSLLELDGERRTPLHTVFFLDKPPSLSIMEILLTSPGENATKLKDLFGRLPLHIAASRGANEGILRLLVEAYADGCYRLNKDGDLPLHLLVRSGRAPTESVELLLRPILDNETICRMSGSQGVELPLHIAAEYNCCYKVLESLLHTYPEAASIQRKRPKGENSSAPLFALEIFEHMKSKTIAHLSQKVNSEEEETEGSSFEKLRRARRKEAQVEITVADLNLRSDLLFVFSSTLPPVKKGESLPTSYRKDSSRIGRIKNLIRSEAIRCVDQRKMNSEIEISDMARLGWYFMCTFNNPKDPNDHYAETVADILKGLSKSAVRVLKDCISNPMSPSPQIPLIDCATPRCKQLILSRIQFVGKYILDGDDASLHESDGSLVIGAKDYSLVKSYEEILSLFKTEEFLDVDDLASITGSIVSYAFSRDDPKSLFIAFAQKIGFDEEGATREYERIAFRQDDDVAVTNEEETGANAVSVQEPNRQEKRDYSVAAFMKFCSSHKINGNGERSVIIKFMKHRSHFLREKSIRSRCDFHGPEFTILPVIDDYDIGRIKELNKESNASSKSHNLSDNKDELYATDIYEQKNSRFSLYKYALVMPRGDRDLSEILLHEECDELTIKNHMYQIGTALKELHSKSIIHGDLNLSNIVRYGTQVALIDFDSSLPCENTTNVVTQIESLGGSSQKFCSGIIPPELILKIDLSENTNFLRNYEKYWNHVLDDVADMKTISANSRQITTIIKKLIISQSQAGKVVGSSLPSIRIAITDQSAKGYDPQKNWKNEVSQSLTGLSFQELPDSLTSCETIQEFSEVWNRLKLNTNFWEKIHPRISPNGRYAYMVKSYDNSFFASFPENNSKNIDLLPSAKYDIWAFGVMLYYVCSGVSLLHLTYNWQLCNFNAYEELYNWNNDIAWDKIKSFVADPLAQNLLMKLLGTEDRRPLNMDIILQHPFFRAQKGEDLYQTLEEYDLKLSLDGKRKIHQNANSPKTLCVEKCCKEVFGIKGDICIPTCFVILPYELHRNSSGNLEAPQNVSSLAIGEQIGKHLLDMITATAKLSFWLKIKMLTSEKNGTEYREKLKMWLKRARTESSHDIAKEIIASIGCNEYYEAICVEMLDEDMKISNAREFIKDPWKAASSLFNKSKHALLKYYPHSRTHPFYLIDERHAVVALPEETPDHVDNVYPIQLEVSEMFQDVFLPFINMTVMLVTAKHGMKGLAMLLGLPSTYGIPDTWQHSKIGLVHKSETSSYSSIAEFANLQQIISKNDRKKSLRTENASSNRRKGDASVGIKALELFYKKYDPNNSFCGLNRCIDAEERDSCWTKYEMKNFQKTFGGRKIQNKMKENSTKDSEISLRHRVSNQPLSQDSFVRDTNAPQSTSDMIRSSVKSRNHNKDQSNSTGSVFTRTTKQTVESLSSVTCQSTMVSNTSLDKYTNPTEPFSVGARQRDESYLPSFRTNEYHHIQGNSPSLVAPATLGKYYSATQDIVNDSYNSKDGGDFTRQGNHPSILSSVTLGKHHPTHSDVSSMISNSTSKPRNVFD